MGRHSDSDDDRKKRKKKKKKRSRSKSLSGSDSSYVSYKHKKSKSSKSRRRSRSISRGRDRRSRSRSRGHRRRSRSIDRYSRSRSRERYSSRRRSRSGSRGHSYRRSRSRERYQRSRSRTPDRYKSKPKRRSRSIERVKGSSRYNSASPSSSSKGKDSKEDPAEMIPGFHDMTPAEQTKLRLQLALKAAAAADERIKDQIKESQFGGASTVEDQMKFSSAVKDIESSTFVPTSFKSTRSDRPNTDDKKDDFLFGTAGEIRADMTPRKPLIIHDLNTLSHPNLHVDPDEKMKRWIERLTMLRKKKLEGEVID
ncbi:serine/Arginine-related protein 53-like [Pecten maximus]|uniref:serine/Arginine-related protein 53-like n=1 Tax=Pecten maximus TaxID=6579 RepID=UPI0014589D3F|nr:serine/Arginine-related protein 53-like [Pecten maximus]